MKNKLIYPIVAVVFAAACGGDGESARKGAGREYEMVQEGSASGVTSTIAGPGETLPPITGTNADTTTAFTIDPNVAPGAVAQQQPAPMGATLPPINAGSAVGSSGMSPGYNPTPAPRSASSSPAPQQRPAYVPPPMTSAMRQPQPQQSQPAPAPAPRETEQTDTASGPAGGTDTTAPPPPTQTAPPPAQQQKPPQAQPQPEQQQEEPAEDEEPAAEEPPPPPPTAQR
jgi:hypothetical protein